VPVLRQRQRRRRTPRRNKLSAAGRDRALPRATHSSKPLNLFGPALSIRTKVPSAVGRIRATKGSPGGPREPMVYRMPKSEPARRASQPTTRNERMSAPGADNKGPAGTLMQGKRGLIMGVANNRSIAWGIAKAAAAQGATLALTYQGDALKKRVEPLAAEAGSKLVLPCDVTDRTSIDGVFAELGRQWGRLDFLVHAIAFSDKAELD